MTNATVDTKKNLDSFGLLGPHIVDSIIGVVRKNAPELKPSMPFTIRWEIECYHESDMMIIFLKDADGPAGSSTYSMSQENVEDIKRRILSFDELSFNNLYNEFKEQYYTFDKFLYIGPSKIGLAVMPLYQETWKHVVDILLPWINLIFLPQLYEIERNRIQKLLLPPVKPNISQITDALWVLECEETFKQGTAFALEGYGLITCEHVLGPATKAFRANDFSKKYDVTVVYSNENIDLAILVLTGKDIEYYLQIGNSEEINQLDQVTVAGFPNYRFGDTGTINTGNVSGYRMVLGIRRMLVSMPLIAGNSGGPVLDSEFRVVGVAVTGADRMENAHRTEHHGVVPIEALQLMKH